MLIHIIISEIEVSPERQLTEYLQLINASVPEELSLTTLANSDRFTKLKELFSRVFCCPATSAPVERVFSQSGLIMRPHRARMTDQLLETLVYLKCNSDA